MNKIIFAAALLSVSLSAFGARLVPDVLGTPVSPGRLKCMQIGVYAAISTNNRNKGMDPAQNLSKMESIVTSKNGPELLGTPSVPVQLIFIKLIYTNPVLKTQSPDQNQTTMFNGCMRSRARHLKDQPQASMPTHQKNTSETQRLLRDTLGPVHKSTPVPGIVTSFAPSFERAPAPSSKMPSTTRIYAHSLAAIGNNTTPQPVINHGQKLVLFCIAVQLATIDALMSRESGYTPQKAYSIVNRQPTSHRLTDKDKKIIINDAYFKIGQIYRGEITILGQAVFNKCIYANSPHPHYTPLK